MWAHDEYLDRLTAVPEVRFRVAAAEEYLRETLGEDTVFDSMFIGNGTVDPLGPSFGGLWFFTEKYRIVIANFMLSPAYQIARAGPIEGLVVQFSNWSAEHASDESVMLVQFTALFTGGGSMAARGLNCTQLHAVVKELLAPKISIV